MNRQRGFSLIELTVVLVLFATLAGIAAMVIGRDLPGQQLRDSARDIAGQLRYTRAQAIATGRPQEFLVDVAGRQWRAPEGRDGSVPEGIDLEVTTARDPRPQVQTAVVRFFPDGAATGGRFVLRRGAAAWRVDVAWLTGEVSLHRGDAPP